MSRPGCAVCFIFAAQPWRRTDLSREWLTAFVIAGAAEPILSKRLQGRKANVVNEASSIAAESARL